MFKSLLLAAGAVSTNAVFYTNDAASQNYLWNQFKMEYSKKYSDDAEDTKRFNIFMNNLKVIDERNTKDANKVHGINKFADLSQEEFASKYLGARPAMKGLSENRVEIVENTSGLTTTKDWAGVLTTPVKDQGYCGSCWAFSATEQLESDTMRVLGKTYILSTEQVTQCTPAPSAGCGGGWTENAYKYIKSQAGIETEADYPYTSYQGRTGTCNINAAKEVVGLTGYTTIGGASASAVETNMANYVLATGPLSVCLDASSWNSYKGGIMSTCGKQVDHCVQAVGVNNAASGGYWKVRNSWGTTWGESGYIRLAYGANTCDITNDPTYVAPKLA